MFNSAKLFSRRSTTYILLAFFITLALFLRIKNAPQNAYNTDEVISLLATQGVIRHGIPVLKHGVVYHRSPLTHYLLAIPVYLWGTGELATRSLSILLSILLMWLVFIMGRDIYDEHVGLLAVIILTFSGFENSNAVSLRFYMAFQFFFTLSIYLFYKGFVEDNNKYKFWCIISSLCTIFSHKIAIELVPIFALFLLFTKRWELLKDKYAWAGVLTCTIAYYITFLYKPPKGLDPATTNDLIIGAAGFWPRYFTALDKMISCSLSVVILGLLFVYFQRDRKLSFYYLAWGTGMAFAALTAPIGYLRYILNLFPLYVLLFSNSLVQLIKSIYSACYNDISRLINNSAVKKTVFISIVLISFSSLMLRVVKNSDFTLTFARPGFKDAHLFLKESIQDRDLLLSTNAFVTEVYVRLPDYFLRQRYVDKEWKEFEFEVDKKGYGYRMLDSIAELEELMGQENRRIWLVADHRFYTYTSPELISFVEKNFKLVYAKKYSKYEDYKVYYRGLENKLSPS